MRFLWVFYISLGTLITCEDSQLEKGKNQFEKKITCIEKKIASCGDRTSEENDQCLDSAIDECGSVVPRSGEENNPEDLVKSCILKFLKEVCNNCVVPAVVTCDFKEASKVIGGILENKTPEQRHKILEKLN